MVELPSPPSLDPDAPEGTETDKAAPAAAPIRTPAPVAAPNGPPAPGAAPDLTPPPVSVPNRRPAPGAVSDPEPKPQPVALPTRTPAPVELPTRTPAPVELPTRTPAPVELPTQTPAPESAPTGLSFGNEIPGNGPPAIPSAAKVPQKPAEPAAISGDAVQDSVEEVLQQTSAQMLQLSRLEDNLAALSQTLADLQDEMHAGFAEIRARSESATSREGERATQVAGSESMTQRLDFVEAQTVSTNNRQKLITALAVGQGLLLIILLVLVLADMRGGPTTEIPEATYTTESVSNTEEVKKAPVVEDPRTKKKRRRKR